MGVLLCVHTHRLHHGKQPQQCSVAARRLRCDCSDQWNFFHCDTNLGLIAVHNELAEHGARPAKHLGNLTGIDALCIGETDEIRAKGVVVEEKKGAAKCENLSRLIPALECIDARGIIALDEAGHMPGTILAPIQHWHWQERKRSGIGDRWREWLWEGGSARIPGTLCSFIQSDSDLTARQ